jgi:transcription initiation factor TFIID subunit 11
MHPLRQTSFPNLEAERSFGGASDAGSVTGSYTGSLGGGSADGVFAGAARGKKRGRKSKAEKEREREDALSSRAGDTRLGSADAEGSVRGMGGGGGGGDDGDEDDDDDEGELLGREEGTTDTEAEKKNLAYVAPSSAVCRFRDVGLKLTSGFG